MTEDVCHQTHGVDCGAFAIAYAELAFRRTPIDATTLNVDLVRRFRHLLLDGMHKFSVTRN